MPPTDKGRLETHPCSLNCLSKVLEIIWSQATVCEFSCNFDIGCLETAPPNNGSEVDKFMAGPVEEWTKVRLRKEQPFLPELGSM